MRGIDLTQVSDLHSDGTKNNNSNEAATMLPNYENAADLSSQINKMLSESGKPFFVGGPAVSLLTDGGKLVGTAKKHMLPDYVVEDALKSGAQDLRFSTLDFSRKIGGDERINENLRQASLMLVDVKAREAAGLTESSNVVPFAPRQ